MNQEPPNIQRPRPSVAGWLLIACSSAVLLTALLTMLGRQFYFAELINNFRLQISILLLLLAFVSLLARMRIWGFAQLLAAVVVLAPLVVSWVPGQQPPAGAVPYSLMSYNILAGREDKESTVQLLADQIPDILVVIEYEESWVEPLQTVANAYLYSILKPRTDGFGIAVFSKYPLSNTKVESVYEQGYPFVLTDIELPDRTVTLAAGHFLSPVTPEQMQIRNAQLSRATELLQERLQDGNQPMLLAADFNAVPWSPFIGDLLQATGLRDSRKGFGYGGSWPTANPLLRIPIDHVFVSDSIHVHARKLLAGVSSDHFPLWMEFSVAADDPE